MGNQGQGATSQLLWLADSGIDHPSWVLQWRGDLRSIQEPPPYGKLVTQFHWKYLHVWKALFDLFIVWYNLYYNDQVNPDDIVFGGWDISDMNLADAMARAKVLDIDLQKQLRPYMESMVPLPGIYDPDFIAANQCSRANNVIKGTKKEQVQQIIKDIR